MTEIEIMLLSLTATAFAWLWYAMAKLGRLEQEIKDVKMKIFSENERLKCKNALNRDILRRIG